MQTSTSTEGTGKGAVSPLTEFKGTMTRPGISALYSAGLAVVAFAMVLLPAIYIGLIVLTGWGVFYYLTHGGWIMSGQSGHSGGIGRIILYLGPPIAGGILVFFMLKPLFARRPKREELTSLDPASEALLFAFVKRVCELVGAPMPCRIDVDCEVNASASLRRGLWSRDLVLTIGLPLVAGLNMREFAGVLAHEFGHFAQGAGMRLTYVIRNINFWFARVVFERDEWDLKLERTAKGLDIRFGVVLHAARGCVWLTRRILWGLMHAGNAISCFMLRQMEYDADRYEAKLAGSGAFESTMTRLRELNVATQIALEEVRQGWASHRLPENLPLLIDHKTRGLSTEVRQKLASAATASKTGWFDSHPCDADRVRAVREANEPGVFRLEDPAAGLFANFAKTSKTVSHHHYSKNWELEFSEQNLVSTDEMLRESADNTAADMAVRKFYGEVNISVVPLQLEIEDRPEIDRAAVRAKWLQARDNSEKSREAAAKASAESVKLQNQMVDFNVARNLTAAGFRIESKEFGLPSHANTVGDQEIAARQAIKEASALVEQQNVVVKEFVSALGTRLSLAAQLAIGTSDSAGERVAEYSETARVLAVVGRTMPVAYRIGMQLRPLLALARNLGNHSESGRVSANMSRLAGDLKKLLAETQGILGGVAYPFPHPRGKLTIVEYARYEKPCENEIETAYHDSNAHLERLFALHYRLLGRLLVLAEAIESGLEVDVSKQTG